MNEVTSRASAATHEMKIQSIKDQIENVKVKLRNLVVFCAYIGIIIKS